MTRPLEVKEIEFQRGYRRLGFPLPSFGGVWPISIAILALIIPWTGADGVSAFWLVALLACVGMSFYHNSRPQVLLQNFRAKKIAPTPLVRLLEKLNNETVLINFGNQRKLVVGLDAQVAADGGWQTDLDNLALKIKRPVQVVCTTGIPGVHLEGYELRNPQFTYLLMIDLEPWDDARKIWDVVIVHLPTVLVGTINDSLFDSSAPHGWLFSHWFAKDVNMASPFADLLGTMEQTGGVDFTAVLQLEPGENGKGQTLAVGIDVFLYAENKPFLNYAENRLVHGPKETLPANSGYLSPERERWHNFQFCIIQRSSLKLAALFVRPLFGRMRRYQKLAPPVMLETQQSKQR